MSVSHVSDAIKMAQLTLENDNFESARKEFGSILLVDDQNVAALIGLGDSCFGLGDYESAETAYRKGLVMDPSNPDALFSLAATLRVTEYYNEAVTLYRLGFDEEPDRTEAYWELAYSLEMLDDKVGAEEAYKTCLRHHPEHGMATHLLAAMTGMNTARAPQNYVRDLFDDYAETFDSELIDDLKYVVPDLIENALSRHLAETHLTGHPPIKRVLDLGCGTGLVAKAIQPLAHEIIGVDLSPKMLEIAVRDRRINQSVVADMVEFITGPTSNDGYFNLIVCGDAIVYLGDLKELIKGISQRLDRGGLFCFTAEDIPNGNFKLMPSGRYGHNSKYITDLLTEFSFTIIHDQPIIPRSDSNQDVQGHLYLSQLITQP